MLGNLSRYLMNIGLKYAKTPYSAALIVLCTLGNRASNHEALSHQPDHNTRTIQSNSSKFLGVLGKSKGVGRSRMVVNVVVRFALRQTCGFCC